MRFERGIGGNISTRWQKGQSGNPKGMAKGTRQFATVVRELAEKGFEVKRGKEKKIVNMVSIAMALLDKADQGYIGHIQEFADRVDGKVLQEIRSTVIMDDDNDLSQYSTEELEARLAELEEKQLELDSEKK